MRIPLGRSGHASAVQLAFVPALFVLPLGLVLPVVCLGLLIGGLGPYLRGRKALSRTVPC